MSFIKNFFRKIFSFANRRPVSFLAIIVGIMLASMFLTYEVLHATSKAEFCKFCHPNDGVGAIAEYSSWKNTMHATNGVSCLDCHTIEPGAIGYAHSKVVVGMRDVYMQIKMSSQEKHDALSKFVGNPELAEKLVPAKVCLHCHSDFQNTKNIENHFMTVLGVPMRDLDTVVNPAFRQMYGMPDILTEPVSAGVEPNHAKHMEMGVNCASCHTSVAHSGNFYAPISMQTCIDCHDSQQTEIPAGDLTVKVIKSTPVANDDCTTCHVTQVALQAGTVGAKQGVEGDAWYMAGMGCMDCHETAFTIPTEESCASCHDDEYAMLMVEQKGEFISRYTAASDFYMSMIKKRTSMASESLVKFNEYENLMKILEKDGSHGMHNPDYAVMILDHLESLKSDIK